MNYYEELGLTPQASAEEIRQAYKNLARVLHPDQFQEAPLRRAGELQMKRLNAVVAVLSDAAERRRYDLSLAPGPVAVLGRVRMPVAARLEAARRSWAWWLAAAIGLAALAFYSASGTRLSRASPAGGPARVPAVAAEAPPTVAPQEQPSPPPRARREPVRSPLPEAPRPSPLPALAAPAPSEPVWEPAPFAARRSFEAAALSPPPPPQARPPAPSLARLAGAWLYAPAEPPPRTDLVYPPEYIELRITEEPGTIFGRYRARYIIPDRAVSPEVNFHFEGAAAAETFLWTGPGGASGEVRLKRLAADSLEVTWWATELGKYLGLASGTAVLTRH